jgi:hypothetical protein
MTEGQRITELLDKKQARLNQRGSGENLNPAPGSDA